MRGIRMDLQSLRAVIDSFPFPGTLAECAEIKTGHINHTCRLRFSELEGDRRYLLQRINTYVFKKPDEVMENIDRVTTHIYRKRGGVNVLHFHHTAEGKNRKLLRFGLIFALFRLRIGFFDSSSRL